MKLKTMFTKERLQPYIDEGLISEKEHPLNPNLRIYNYTHRVQIEKRWDEVTERCRGLILDWSCGTVTKKGTVPHVAANPFPKFWNLGEREIQLPNEEPRIYEKYDGSLGILYWEADRPWIATRGSFTSEQAQWATDCFRKIATPKLLHKFDRSKTYLFEILYRANRIVVAYPFEGLVLIAVRDTETGKENEIEANTLWYSADGNIRLRSAERHTVRQDERDNAEGYVLFYPSTGQRVKVKHAEYVRLHRIVTNVTPRSIWDAMRHGSDLKDILERVPDEFYGWVQGIKNELQDKFDGAYHHARKVAEEAKALHPTRKEQAIFIQAQRVNRGAAFAHLDGRTDTAAEAVWRTLKPAAERPYRTDE